VNRRGAGIELGIMFFGASAPDPGTEAYGALLRTARFADDHGFRFVATPERHYHRFGGMFPNPTVLAATLTALTEHLQVRACSLIGPLHESVRIVEDWSLLDRLSAGRVGISLGSGWNANDFSHAKERYADRRSIVFTQLDEIRELWRTGSIAVTNPLGKEVLLDLYPRPLSAELPLWITASRSEETFRGAGRHGANLLSHLETQDVGELERKIVIYREAREEGDHDPSAGVVTVMQHAFVDADGGRARALAAPYLASYLSEALALERSAVSSGGTMSGGRAPGEVPPEVADREGVIEAAVERYLGGASLIGSVGECRDRCRRLLEAGVDEVACLVDFVSDDATLEGALPALAELRSEVGEEAGQRGVQAALEAFNADLD
jgi:natural product biosynthesis luciferase-like monooxygenase protein